MMKPHLLAGLLGKARDDGGRELSQSDPRLLRGAPDQRRVSRRLGGGQPA